MARVLIAAGASGGHVYPALVVAEVLRERGHDLSFVGGDRLETRLVPEAGFPLHPLPVKRPPSVRRELISPKGIAAVASIVRATSLAKHLLRTVAPDVVLGMGGFPSVPVTVAAGRSRIPLVLHEQNANLSLAQRIPLRWADVLALGLPLTREPKSIAIEVTGQPIRRSVIAVGAASDTQRAEAKRRARESLGLDVSTPTLLVFGGSLGSVPLNERLPEAPLPAQMQVLHLCGRGREASVRTAWDRAGRRAVVLGYLESIEDAYAAADLVVSRSGGLTVGELAVAGLPAVLVPLPTLRRGDQEANARVLERAGAAIVVMQSHERFEEVVGKEVTRLLADASARDAMSRAARSVARPDGAERLADVMEGVIRVRRG